MTTQGEKQELLECIADLFEIKDKNFINRDEWGAINFKQVRHDVESVLRIATELVDLPLEYLPSTVTTKVSSQIISVTKILHNIDSFRIDIIGDPTQLSSRYCDELHQESESLICTIAQFLQFLASRRDDIRDNIAAIKNATSEAEQSLRRVKEQEARIEQEQKTVDGIVRTIRQASADIGVEKFTPKFDKEADSLSARSKIWLKVTIGLAIATLVAACISYFFPEVSQNVTDWDTMYSVLSKAAIIAILFAGTIWCGRIYRALAHQATVNRHRALSLQTFQTFVEGTEDKQVRDAVLMAATNTVFANVPTGFVEPSGDQDSKLNIVELSKSFMKRSE